MILTLARRPTDRGSQPDREQAIGIPGDSSELPGRPGVGGTSERGRPTRVLVVEVDRTMRHLVVNYLREHGIQAASASGGVEMIQACGREAPDLVILDLRLGQEDGLDLLRELRAQSDVPVIITTGHRRDEIDRVVGLEL